MRLRQIALVARDLTPVVADLCAVLDLGAPFHDPGVAEFGLRNAVMPVGDTFLEVVSPVRPDATAQRYLDRRRGDGGYMVIVQSNDLDADRARLAALGVRIVWEITLDDIATIHLHPRDVGGAIVSIDQARPPASWRWAGPDWHRRVRNDVTRTIAGAEIQATDPAVVSARWAAVLDRPVLRASDARWEIALDAGTLAFVPPGDERGDGLAAIRVAAVDPDALAAEARRRGLADDAGHVRIGGVRIDVEARR